MRIEYIDLGGFRGIPELRLEFPEQINVLVGVNGAGKSAVLDCTAIMLSRLIDRFRSTKGAGRLFSESDIDNHVQATRIEIALRFREPTVSWGVTKSRRGYPRRFLSELEDLRRHAEVIRLELEEDESSALRLPSTIQSIAPFSTSHYASGRDINSTGCPHMTRHSKCTLAMVGDPARRMAIANPNMTDPLPGDAIALTDEADLHLHPSWPRRLASALGETFPNCQFLLSTHSPAILRDLYRMVDRLSCQPSVRFAGQGSRLRRTLLAVQQR